MKPRELPKATTRAFGRFFGPGAAPPDSGPKDSSPKESGTVDLGTEDSGTTNSSTDSAVKPESPNKPDSPAKSESPVKSEPKRQRFVVPIYRLARRMFRSVGWWLGVIARPFDVIVRPLGVIVRQLGVIVRPFVRLWRSLLSVPTASLLAGVLLGVAVTALAWWQLDSDAPTESQQALTDDDPANDGAGGAGTGNAGNAGSGAIAGGGPDSGGAGSGAIAGSTSDGNGGSPADGTSNTGTTGPGNAGTNNAGTDNSGTGGAGTDNAGTGNAGTSNAGTNGDGTGNSGTDNSAGTTGEDGQSATGALQPNTQPNTQPNSQSNNDPNNQPNDPADDRPRDSITRDGMYLVGTDIVPGRYIASGEGSLCYLAVTSDASGKLDSIIRTHFGDAFGRRVDLEEDEFFETDACGTWQLETANP